MAALRRRVRTGAVSLGAHPPAADFARYLDARNISQNCSIVAYQRDLEDFGSFLKGFEPTGSDPAYDSQPGGRYPLADATPAAVAAYIGSLRSSRA